MNRLLVATRSRGKQAEFLQLLAPVPYEIVFPDEIGLGESDEESQLEPFDTFEANARSKARWFAQRSGLATVADDSGLEVDAIGGAPGVHSKRFGGVARPDHLVTAANNAKLLQLLDGLPDERRSARYRCVLAMVPSSDSEIIASGAVEGCILYAPRGDLGFGYDPLFYSFELGRTFGEADAAAKHSVSHRGRAVTSLVNQLLARR